jgi:hypothetical protein
VSIFLRSFLTQVILSSRPKSAGGRFVQGMFNCLSHQLCIATHRSRRRWQRGPDSNRRIRVRITPPLPLGYRALVELEDLAECCNDAVAPGLCHCISYLEIRDADSDSTSACLHGLRGVFHSFAARRLMPLPSSTSHGTCIGE